MFSKAGTLTGYKLESLDGTIGKVKEFYFDDRHWTIRYLVADTGTWLARRQVLISPYALVAVNKVEQNIVVNLTKKQIEASPALNSDKPVSHQFEHAYYGHYGWPEYWNGPHIWGSHPFIMRDRDKWKDLARSANGWDRHLRSTYGVNGHHIQALDGEVGHVQDFIIDDETWAIRYLVVDTQNWWPGKKVLISPRSVQSVDWSLRSVMLSIARQGIKDSPAYDGSQAVDRAYEYAYHGYYDHLPVAEPV